MVSWTPAYVRSTEWIGSAFDPEKFNDDFEDSLRDTKSTSESNLDFGTSDA